MVDHIWIIQQKTKFRTSPYMFSSNLDNFYITHLSLDNIGSISQTISQMHFREWKVLCPDENWTEDCSEGYNW